MSLHVFVLDDGATHWIAAEHPSAALRFLCDSLGMTRTQYLEEYEDHSIRRMDPSERIELRLDCAPVIPEHELRQLPKGTHLVVTAHTLAREWLEKGEPGIIGSTDV